MASARLAKLEVDEGGRATVDRSELQGAAFRCLEGCGFCCTFMPEASALELARLRARLKPRPLPVSVDPDGRQRLGLQNKCGACTLLERRGCTQYDLRPAHCRYFPFHVHFAERPEVYLNYTCRGVERVAGGALDAAFDAAVLAVAKPEELVEHERLAREAYGEFQRRARRAGAWGDVDAALRDALAPGAALFTARGLEATCARGGEQVSADDALAEARAVFEEPDVTRRPFYLTSDLRWLTFGARPDGGLDVLEMDERGTLAPAGLVPPLAWADLPAPVADALASYLARLAQRRLFAGSVYALVDDLGYALTVAQAAQLRVAEVVADLALRARILAALGVPEASLADETARFYDTTFLDSPTIGGFL